MIAYLDHNATTPLRPEVWEAMARVEFGEEMVRNPSSVHKAGITAHRVVAGAHEALAQAIGASPDEIIVTGGGSEAINLALKGTVWASERERPHIIASVVEHHAVLHALEWLQTQGVDVTLLPVDIRGQVAPEAVAEAIGPRTALVSLILVNNETGFIQDVEQIGALCRERSVPLHLDGVQALGKIPLDVDALPCDLMSCSAHKIGGPKGVGMLYARQGTALSPLVHGGPQERRLRAGTENVQGMVGFAEAVRLALEERDETWARWIELRETLYRLPREINVVRVNSDPGRSVPNCVNISFMFCDGMTLTTNLSARGVYASTGSACTAGDLAPSHVLKGMGLSDKAAHGAVRFSMGRGTTQEELEYAVETTRTLVKRLRLVTAPEDIGKCKDDCPCFLNG